MESDLPRPVKLPEHCGQPRPSRHSRYRAISLILVHVAVIGHVIHWQLTGRTLTPLEPSESMQTLEQGLVNAGFVFFAGLILVTLILGRFFCGWACHVVAYQDLCSWLMRRIGVVPGLIRSRLLILIPFGVAFYMFAWPQVVRLLEGRAPPELVAHLTTNSFWKTMPGFWVGLLTLLVDGFLIVYLLGAKSFCAYGCPYGAFFQLADRLAPGRIRVNEACMGCGHCTSTCSSNVRVHEEVARFGAIRDQNCMKCLDCVSVCPTNALSYRFGTSGFLKRLFERKRRMRRTYDFSWPEEFFLLALFLLALYAFRGLYGVVPFLLSIGIAVIVACSAVVFFRMIRRGDLRFRERPLLAGGRFTRTGLAAAALIGMLLAFTFHSAVVQYHLREGGRLLARARELPPEQRPPLLTDGLEHLRRAERLGLFTHTGLLDALSGTLRFQGDRAGAAEYLKRSCELEPAVEKHLELSTLRLQLGEVEATREALLRALELEPGNPTATERLGLLERQP
ncbi:MAG: 4Fe-4S binding protein [Planctomycetota bacterium]